jgi:hypothetical protein
LRCAWHLTTVLAWTLAVLLVQLAEAQPASWLLRSIGAGLLLSGLLPLVFTRGRHLAWVVLFIAGGLCLAASTP